MNDSPQKHTYAAAGVDYGQLDRFKRACQEAAALTDSCIETLGGKVVPATRGESASLVEYPDRYETQVLECLGTKALVADAMAAITGRDYYYGIGIDLGAMVFNDICVSGARPDKAALYVAVGSSDWFGDERRWRSLIAGWKEACHTAGCAWLGGETPSLSGVIEPGAVDLAASASGVIEPKQNRIDAANLRDGDTIVMVGSSGIHANGVSIARKVGESVGYDTQLGDGRMYGEALLTPTPIYVPLVRACRRYELGLSYASNITGHGLAKVMRAPRPFVYVLEHVAEPQPEFGFIEAHANMDPEEMYSVFNMGNGLALFVRPEDTGRLVKLAQSQGLDAWQAGFVEQRGEVRQVEMPGLDLVLDELGVR